MLDIIAKFILSFSHDTIIIPLVILGYIWLDKDVFYHAICLIFINMVFNFVLKIILKIPLSPMLGHEGFAFPSGHMQNSIVLYGWIIYKAQNILYRLLMVTLLVGIAFSLIHFGYHNYYDILGAIFFALMLLSIYYLILIKRQSASFLIILLVFIFMLYIDITYKIANHLWMACYGLIGIIFSENRFGTRNAYCNKMWNKIFSSILCFSIIFAIKALFTIEVISNLPPFLYQFQWAIISFCLPLCRVIPNFKNCYVKVSANKS